MAAIQRLGEPPNMMGQRVEQPVLLIETHAGTGDMEQVQTMFSGFSIEHGSGDGLIPTARIQLRLGRDPVAWPGVTEHLVDWQVMSGAAQIQNIWDRALGGRRVQIRTSRPSPADNWYLFDGFADRLTLGWSGEAEEQRTATLECSGAFVAASREPNQFLVGQWRRSRNAALAPSGTAAARECVLVTALPCIFNPGGVANCDPEPLVFGDGVDAEHIYIFTDAGNPRAIEWNVARMLTYVRWASLQRGLPTRLPPASVGGGLRYAEAIKSDANRGPDELESEVGWTSRRLSWGNVSALAQQYVAVGAAYGAGLTDPRLTTMVRIVDDLSNDCMSVLEALALICDRAGILVACEVTTTGDGDARSAVRLSIRGDRRPPLQPGSPSDGGDGMDEPSSRGVSLFLPSDRVDNSAFAAPGLFAVVSTTEGTIEVDEGSVRTIVHEVGAPGEFEAAWPLMPGWDNTRAVSSGPSQYYHWDDVPAGDIVETIARLGDSTWLRLYGRRSEDPHKLAQAGRVWILNEDGFLMGAPGFARSLGPWASAERREPFVFWGPATVRVSDLSHSERQANGWAPRRRRLLPCTERDGLKPQVYVQISWTGDNGPWYFTPAACVVFSERCGIMFTVDSMLDETLTAPPQHPSTPGRSFPEAYIRGEARVRAIAVIEGDDAVRGLAESSGFARLNEPRVMVIDRRRQTRRRLHSSVTDGDFEPLDDLQQLVETDDVDMTDSADLRCGRVRDEIQSRSAGANIVVPWIARPDAAAWNGFRHGDEAMAIVTRLGLTRMDLLSALAPGILPAPRVTSVRYNWSDQEQSTEVILERPAVSEQSEARDASAAVAWSGGA